MKNAHVFLALMLMQFCISLYSQNPDIRLLRAINSPSTLRSDNFFQFVSNSDMYFVIGVPAGMAATGLIKNDDRLFRNACVTLAATAVNFGITAALKYSVNRERPYVTYPDITKKSKGGSPSFPSGHTSSAFATATSVSLAYPKWYIIAPSFTWASAVGYSRMHLGVHYPSDVLAGAFIGAGSAWLTYEINKKLNKKSRRKPCNCPHF
jgi:membrane-associated phospholipid phosphatase